MNKAQKKEKLSYKGSYFLEVKTVIPYRNYGGNAKEIGDYNLNFYI